MKKEIADKWVEALRSGEYKQSTGNLKNDKGFCCLGVLCEISKQTETGKYYTKFEDRNGVQNKILPEIVQKWAGLNSVDGTCQSGDSLTQKNDHGMDFKGIANIIEKEWKTL